MLRFGRDSRSAQPWLRPPRLRTLAEEERHASWLELFFDLVFVVAIAELSHELVVNHTLNGFAIFAALFVPVFVAWQGFGLHADHFETTTYSSGCACWRRWWVLGRLGTQGTSCVSAQIC
jgi:hypothetical protein